MTPALLTPQPGQDVQQPPAAVAQPPADPSAMSQIGSLLGQPPAPQPPQPGDSDSPWALPLQMLQSEAASKKQARQQVQQQMAAIQEQQKQLSQQLQAEMQPGGLQKWLPKPTAANILQDGLYNSVRSMMAMRMGAAPPEPIQAQRMASALGFQKERLAALQQQLSNTHNQATALLTQQHYDDQADSYTDRLLAQLTSIKQRDDAAKAKINAGVVPFPAEIADFYKGLPKEFASKFPVSPPSESADGNVTVAELKQLQSKYNKDADSYMKWLLSANPGSKTLNNVGLALKTVGWDGDPSHVTPAMAAAAQKSLQKQQPGVSLSPDAIQFWAKYAATTGQLPSLGMGGAGAQARTDILNAAPSLSGGTDVSAAKANYGSDSNLLRTLQKNRGLLGAYEATANQNLDMFLGTAKKAIDSGSPWINKPLREVAVGALGDADLAAFNAARQVALREIANVTNNPQLSAVMSEQARKDVLGLLPESATLKQVYAVASVLRSDMSARTSKLDKEIETVQTRLRGPSTGGRTNPPPVAPPAPVGASSAVDRLVQKYGGR